MVYFCAAIGLVLGFIAGLVIINIFLKGYSGGDLLKDKSLRWTYGLAVWIFAGLGAWLSVWLYNRSIF